MQGSCHYRVASVPSRVFVSSTSWTRPSYDWWNFMVDTGHVPSWPLMEIRGREIQPTRDSILCASDPIGQDDGLAEELS